MKANGSSRRRGYLSKLYRALQQKSSFTQHTVERKNINHTEENVEILPVCRKSRRMDTLEEFKIHKALKNTPRHRFK